MGKLWRPDNPFSKLVRAGMLVESWIEKVVQGDHDRGYNDSRFSISPRKQFSQEALDEMRGKGWRIYLGGGNFFLANLNGERPTVMQRRPLAARYVKLEAE